jgi:hypothetical protein
MSWCLDNFCHYSIGQQDRGGVPAMMPEFPEEHDVEKIICVFLTEKIQQFV